MNVMTMNSCTLFYEAWQIQCCGEPFSVGDKVRWTCAKTPNKYKNRHGIQYDFDEEHHGDETHMIIGTVNKIFSECSESPKETKSVSYDDVVIMRKELQSANGWESEPGEDDTIRKDFWGYMVELGDVVVKPLNRKHNASKVNKNHRMWFTLTRKQK